MIGLVFLGALLASMWLLPQAHAGNVVGFLVSEPGQPYKLKVQDSAAAMTIEAGEWVVTTLKHLRDGSLIVGTGHVSHEQKTVHLDSVQTVGLTELLGTWQSSRWEVFEFRDFNSLMRYLPMENSRGSLELKFVESYDYVLTPDNQDTYSIFITDNSKRMMVGTLHLSAGSVILTVYDSETGRESEKISLSPLSLK